MPVIDSWISPAEGGQLDRNTGDNLTQPIWEALLGNLLHLGGTAGYVPAAALAADVRPSCRVYNSTDWSVANSTSTAIPFNSERYDNDAIHDTVSNTTHLTAKTAGVYRITGSADFDANATGFRDLSIRLNGITSIASQSTNTVGVAYYTKISVSTEYVLAVNDYVELMAFQNSGGALLVKVNNNDSPEFSLVRVG
jgi:hypothetical protein